VSPDDVVNMIIRNIDDNHVQIKKLLGNFVIECLVSDDMVKAVEAYINKRIEKAKVEARIDEHTMVRDEWSSPGISYLKTKWSINRLEELSKLQKEDG
jgi:hypothetical protein